MSSILNMSIKEIHKDETKSSHKSILQVIQSTDSAKYTTIAMCCLAMFLDNMSVSGLIYGQQGIKKQFGASDSEASWTLSAYSITFGSFLLLSGSAGDVFGHKIIFVSGLILFMLCCLLISTVSSNLIAVIIFRAIQGVAAACTIPTAYALTAITVEGRAREYAIVILGIAQCVGIVTGTILGGVFSSSQINYRGLFYLSFGISLLGTVISIIVIPSSPSKFQGWKSLDYFGAGIITTAVLMLVLGFSEAENGWRQAQVVTPLTIGGLGIIIFWAFENTFLPSWLPNVDPLIPKRVWKYKNFIPILVITALFYATFFSFQLNGAQFLVLVQGHSTIIASIMFLPIAGGAIVIMPLFGAFYNHRFMPPKYVIAAGQMLLVIAIFLFTRNESNTKYWIFTFPSFVLTPLGAASFFINFLNVVFANSPAEEQGLISGITQMFAQICTALGFSIAGTFVTSGNTGNITVTGNIQRSQYVNGFYFSMSLASLNVLVALLFVKPIPRRSKIVSESGPEFSGQNLRQ